jgi:acyl carrier protein
MTKDHALDAIHLALRKTLNRHDLSVKESTHLIEDGVVDSLDSMVFLMELSTQTGMTIPDEDANNREFFKVSRLVEFLSTRSPGRDAHPGP